MSSNWFNELQELTAARTTATGIKADMDASPDNKIGMEAFYESKGPWVMTILIGSRDHFINAMSPYLCVQRANDLYGDTWAEKDLKTQKEFFKESKK